MEGGGRGEGEARDAVEGWNRNANSQIQKRTLQRRTQRSLTSLVCVTSAASSAVVLRSSVVANCKRQPTLGRPALQKMC